MTTHVHRFFVEPSQITDGQATIAGPDARQIGRVLRLKPGDPVNVLDGSGVCYSARISGIANGYVTATIVALSTLDTEPAVRLTLAQGLPKGDKFSTIVQKGTELGVSEFVGITCERCVVRPIGITGKQARWRRIAKEAAEQCGRAAIPVIGEVQSLPEALERVRDYDLVLTAWEDESTSLLTTVLRENKAAKTVLLVIGPEGGFSQQEAEYAAQAGARLVSLGSRVLRTETAALAASAIILNELEGHL